MKNTICPLPWINMAQTKNGSCNVCSNNIVSTLGIVNEQTSTDFQQIRHEMLDGKVPSYCTKCFKEEERGVKSKRLRALAEFQNFTPENANPHPLKSIEVYSEFVKDIEDTSNVRYITFLEENSLELESHDKFLIDLYAKGQAKNISLTYNLNNLKGLNNKIINIWGQFKHVTFNVRIDGIDEKHNWFNPDMPFHTIGRLFDFLSGVKANHVDINITAQVNLLTAPYLDRLARWRRDSTFGLLNPKGELINLQFDTNPNLDLRRLPMHLKGYTKLKIERLLDQHRADTLFNSNGRSMWQGIIEYMYSEDLSQNLPDTLNYLREQDIKNNTNWKEVFPELADIEDEVV
jgi:hypothetical protein